MSLFLAFIEIEKKGEKVSINILKKKRDDKNFVQNMTS
jgi:hypothetical protein